MDNLLLQSDSFVNTALLIVGVSHLTAGNWVWDFLEAPENHYLVTQEVLLAAARNEARGWAVMEGLLNMVENLEVGEEVLLAAAGNGTWGLAIWETVFEMRKIKGSSCHVIV